MLKAEGRSGVAADSFITPDTSSVRVLEFDVGAERRLRAEAVVRAGHRIER
jgi:hypothetical protein